MACKKKRMRCREEERSFEWPDEHLGGGRKNAREWPWGWPAEITGSLTG